MIRSFGNLVAEAAWQRRFLKGAPNDLMPLIRRKLVQIHNAKVIADLQVPPGNRLERLHGDREGQYSLRVNRQWRICFRWQDGDAFGVEVVDYH